MILSASKNERKELIMAHLVKTDKNGTEYWVEHKCSKCGGTGYIKAYDYVDGGVCFQCGGSGLHTHTWKVYTPEYETRLIERRLNKARKEAPEKNAQFFAKMGADEQGNVWVVMGDTFAIKDAIKEAGGKFCKVIGWHFDKQVEGFETQCFGVESWTDVTEVGTYKEMNTYDYDLDDYIMPAPAIKAAQNAYRASQSHSHHVYNVGDKVELSLTVKRVSGYDTAYGWTSVYTMEDSEGNVFVWKTAPKDMEKDETYHMKGTVKENSEWNGIKQTVLTRCKML